MTTYRSKSNTLNNDARRAAFYIHIYSIHSNRSSGKCIYKRIPWISSRFIVPYILYKVCVSMRLNQISICDVYSYRRYSVIIRMYMYIYILYSSWAIIFDGLLTLFDFCPSVFYTSRIYRHTYTVTWASISESHPRSLRALTICSLNSIYPFTLEIPVSCHINIGCGWIFYFFFNFSVDWIRCR